MLIYGCQDRFDFMDTTDFYMRYVESKTPKWHQLELNLRCPICHEYSHHPYCVYHNPTGEPLFQNRFVAHSPNAYELDKDDRVGFNTVEELLNIPSVRGMSEIKGFYRYSVSLTEHKFICYNLMAEYDGGLKWWVIGHLRDGSSLKLPTWVPIYENH